MQTNNSIAVEVHKLEKKFGNFTAVDHISFEVKKGEIFGFLGPNGAGKSTTIRMLCGILSPTSGQGHVAGFDINSQQEKIKQNIAMRLDLERGKGEAAFEDADLILEERFTTQPQHQGYMQPRDCVAAWYGDRLTLWAFPISPKGEKE